MTKNNRTINRRDLEKLAAKWKLDTQDTHVRASELESSEELLRDLVSMPTTTGNYEANHDAFDYLDRFFSERGMFIKRYEWNGVESLVASTSNTKTPTVCLFGHIDVVPGPDEIFQLRDYDDRYYGRGVLDMKGGIAAFLGAVQKLQNDLTNYDFSVMITSDEEVGGFDGAVKLAEEGYRPKMMVIPDGGGNWNLERFAKGIWHVTLEAKGRSAHGSRPWEGENAIEKLYEVVQQVKALFPDPMSPETSTFNVGIIHGGKAINQIPSTASASLDLRFSSAEEQSRLVGEIENIVEKTKGISFTTEVEAETMTNDPNDPYLKKFATCIKHATGYTPKWVVSNAGNDGRFFAKHDIPCAITYPPGANHHGPDEYIEKEAFFQFQQIVVEYLQKVAKKPKTTPRKKAAAAKQ